MEAERLGQGAHQLAEGRLQLRARVRRRSGGEEQGTRLAGAQAAEVGATTTCEAPAAAPPLLGVDRQPRHAERVEVAPGGPLGHLELGGHLGRRHPASLLQEQEDGDEAVGTHLVIMCSKPVRR